MGFEDRSKPEKYYKYNECEQGQVLVDGATYRGEREGMYGIQHIFKQEDGQFVILNSSGHLNWLLENRAAVGDYVRVTYDGLKKLDKGKFAGKDSHQFVLEIDEDKYKAVSGQPAMRPTGEVEEDKL